ncbi:MAG: major capsid family protein [Waterburya sp.]
MSTLFLDDIDIASAGMFLQRELEQKLTKVYEKKYANLWAEQGQYLTARPDLQLGAEFITEEVIESVGRADEISELAMDGSTVSVSATEFRFNTHVFATSYNYSILKLNAARFAKKDINARLAVAADRAIRQRIHDLAVFGSTKRQSSGLFNDANVPVEATSYNPNTATFQQHIDFVAQICSNVEDRNSLTENVGTLLVPNKLLYRWKQQYQSNDSGKTVYSAIMDNFGSGSGGSITTIAGVNECKSSELIANGVLPVGSVLDRVIFLPSDPDAVERLYYPPMTLAPQLNGMNFRVITFAGTSQTIIHTPQALAYVNIPTVL